MHAWIENLEIVMQTDTLLAAISLPPPTFSSLNPGINFDLDFLCCLTILFRYECLILSLRNYCYWASKLDNCNYFHVCNRRNRYCSEISNDFRQSYFILNAWRNGGSQSCKDAIINAGSVLMPKNFRTICDQKFSEWYDNE